MNAPMSDRLEMRIPPKLKADAQAAAEAEERTLSQWVLEAIRDRLRKQKRRG